jgi:hypothetical protein
LWTELIPYILMGDALKSLAAPRQRVIRVFISSTFLDMFEEREELVKRVFPQLRAICEQRAVIWSEVDLRWGITKEDAGKGRALSICLDEVDNCRPYFIALLGDRYGWIPDRYPEDLLEERPWIKEHLSKSITELEILYGALGHPGVPAKAFFYLRDGPPPSGVASPRDLRSDDEDSRRKLAELKDRVQSSGFRVHHYREPVQVGRLLLEDFRELIELEFPEHPPPGRSARKRHTNLSSRA